MVRGALFPLWELIKLSNLIYFTKQFQNLHTDRNTVCTEAFIYLVGLNIAQFKYVE